MTRILFVCHGNICRSPMAEFVFREMAEKRGMGALFHAASAATSGEELGNPVHQGTREKLQAVGISCADKRAVRLRPDAARTEFRSGGARPFVYFVRQAQASPSSMPRTTAISCAAAPACSRYDSAVP